MKAIEVSKDDVLDFLKLELISEIRSISLVLELYEKKHSKGFEEFEKVILDHKENFREWDDYIEWKAYRDTYNDRSNKLKELDNAEDIKITAG